jgi:hypothetical protein
MAKIIKPRSVKGVAGTLSKRLFIESKVLRKAIDRNPQVKQILQVDGEFAKKYEEFGKAYEKASKGMSQKDKESSRKTFQVDGQSFQIRTGKKIVDKKANFRQQKRVAAKLFPDLSESYELGHKNISVLRSYIALALDTFEDDPDFTQDERKALLALYQITGDIDKIDRIVGSTAENKVELIDKLRAAVESGANLKVDWTKDVSLLRGIEGTIELELEWKELNQFKGRLSAWVGGMFADIVKGSMDSFTRDLGNMDITDLRGSRTIPEDLEEMIASTIDPKKKYTKKKTKGTAISTSKKKAPAKTARKRLKKIKQRTAGKDQRNNQAISVTGLLTMLNSRLPDTVAKNMNAPGLENRTGRFASSVRVTDIQSTRTGLPSIGYTYRKNPYQVYESTSGSKFASVKRDPRTLIDQSIREIAKDMVQIRLYTRRV